MRNKNSRQALGRIVFISPFLESGPQHRQGSIGRVVDHSATDENLCWVEFEDRSKVAYRTEGLLTMYPKTVIHDSISADPDLPVSQSNALLKVYQFIKDGKHEIALTMACGERSLRPLCTTSLKDWLEAKLRKKVSRKKGI